LYHKILIKNEDLLSLCRKVFKGTTQSCYLVNGEVNNRYVIGELNIIEEWFQILMSKYVTLLGINI